MSLPTPHGDKLTALLGNEKLPAGDRDLVHAAVERYRSWLEDLRRPAESRVTALAEAVRLLNEYRLFVDVQLVFDSTNDFLYRQKGQLKLDNSVVEEFLPHLVAKVCPEVTSLFNVGPQSCFSGLYFTSTVTRQSGSPGALTRTKDQDFTISKPLYLKASFDATFRMGVDTLQANLGYLCAECKTNLDKTMFQEASATAHDVKVAVPGARYLLLCEWLDMTPTSTSGSDIDEVLILRKAKRLGSQVRSAFATREGRVAGREKYVEHQQRHPFAVEVFERFLLHVQALFEDREPDEADVLQRGYF